MMIFEKWKIMYYLVYIITTEILRKNYQGYK